MDPQIRFSRGRGLILSILCFYSKLFGLLTDFIIYSFCCKREEKTRGGDVVICTLPTTTNLTRFVLADFVSPLLTQLTTV